MELIIDTSKGDYIFLKIKKDDEFLAEKEFEAKFSQAERLLPEIDALTKNINKNLQDIKLIRVCDNGGAFTALRIGVVTANALSYSLDIPVMNFNDEKIEIEGINLVRPHYSSEPNISIGKKII